MSDHLDHGERPDPSGESTPVVSRHTITIPPEISMVALLGAHDELLRAVERAFPTVTVHVRGNEFHLDGEPSDMALIEDLLDEMMAIVEAGQPLGRDAV